MRPSKSYYPPELKLRLVEEYFSSNSAPVLESEEYSIPNDTFRDWVMRYKALGPSVFFSSSSAPYPHELRLAACREYMEGECSLRDVVVKCGLKNITTLRRWLRYYNSSEGFISHEPSEDSSMTSARKTTYDERLEIVLWCMDHDEDYNACSRKFSVSYYQVYSWVKKYKRKGPKGLEDRRGKGKLPEDMTEIDILKAENRRLATKISQLKS